MTTLPLSPGHVDLWYALVETAIRRGRIDVYRATLPEEEVARADRFHFERDQHRHLLTRALVRRVLSDYTGVAPGAWTFRYNAYGKPSIAEPAGLAIDFNLSHTAGIVVCAVASAGELGVDVEDLSRTCSNLELARRFFALPEVEILEQTSHERQPGVFLEFWTLKEAYIKARGMGLALPLADFAFALQPGGPPRVRFLKDRAGGEDDWRFVQLRLEECYQAAVALCPPDGAEMNVCVRAICP